MVHAIRVQSVGGPEVLSWEEIDPGTPGPGEAHIRHTAVGLNYIDVYFRTGLYPAPTPLTPGMEGAGVVLAVGEGVTEVAPGDRVAYAGGPIGAYAEERILPAAKLIKLPDGIDDQTGAAMMLQGMTVQYLLRSTYRVEPGQTILFHAAAGGVGLIACQWAKHLGITLIGTAGSDEKCQLALDHGAAHCINYRTDTVVERVRALTDGAGVPVVYDSVGHDTWEASLDCLRPRGLMVSFGNASGPVPPVNLGVLSQKGSLYVTRPTLMTYTASRTDLEASAGDLMQMVESGAVRIRVNQTYPLKEAAQAHRDLEARATTGSTVLLP